MICTDEMQMPRGTGPSVLDTTSARAQQVPHGHHLPMPLGGCTDFVSARRLHRPLMQAPRAAKQAKPRGKDYPRCELLLHMRASLCPPRLELGLGLFLVCVHGLEQAQTSGLHSFDVLVLFLVRVTVRLLQAIHEAL